MKQRIAVVDNYDSFTYNLVQYLETLGATCSVFLNDAISVDELHALEPDGVLLSPGPGAPSEAGITLELIRRAESLALLGVCLGHQALAEAFGGRIVRAANLMHGKTSAIHHDGRTVFSGLPSPFRATRYHSLIVDPDSVPGCLEITARTAAGEIMGLRHKHLRLEGVQFHPESILSEYGLDLIRNWLEAA